MKVKVKMNKKLANSNLKRTTKLVAAAIISHYSKNNFPSAAALAAELKVSARTVQRSFSELRERGLLKTDKRDGRGNESTLVRQVIL